MHGHAKNHLLEIVRDTTPIQAKYDDLSSLEEAGLFTNKIENALYTMGAINLKFSKLVNDYSAREKIGEVEFYQLIKGLKKHVSKKRKDVFYYTYEFNEIFQNHINRFYVNIDPGVSKVLRKNNAMFLYLNMASLSNICLSKGIQGTPVFKQMIDLSNIKTKRSRDKRTQLEKKFKLLKNLTELNFDYDFIPTENSKYCYDITLDFYENELTPSIKENNDSCFFNALKIKLKIFFQQKYGNGRFVSEEKFNTWLYDQTTDYEFKLKCYYEEYYNVGKTETLEKAELYCRKVSKEFYAPQVSA